MYFIVVFTMKYITYTRDSIQQHKIAQVHYFDPLQVC